MEADQHLPVRATINLPGLHAGQVVLVDQDEEYVADCIEAGYLVRTEADGGHRREAEG